MAKQVNLILSNAAAVWLSRALMVIPQLFLAPYLLQEIGEVGYGVYVLIWGALMSIEQLQRSLQSGVIKYSAGFLAKGETDEVNRVVSSSFIYSLLLAVAAFVVTKCIVYGYGDPTGLIGNGLNFLCYSLLFIFPLTPYIAVIKAKQRFHVSALADVVSKYTSLLLILWWFHYVESSVEALLIIMACTLFLGRLIQVPFAYRYVPTLKNKFRLFDRTKFKLLCSFGSATVLASICLAIDSAGIRWLMGVLESPVFVAHLAIILMPGLLLSQVLGPLMMTLMPATSASYATGDSNILERLLTQSMRYGVIVAMLTIIVAVLLLKGALGLWVGVEYQFLAPYALAFLICEGLRIGSSPGHHMLKGVGRIRSVVWIYWTSLVIVPILLIYFIFRESGNPYIASIFGICSGRILCAILQVTVSARTFEIPLLCLITRSFFQPIALTIVIVSVGQGLVMFWDLNSIFALIILAILSGIVFLIGIYYLCTSLTERDEIKRVVDTILTKVLRKKIFNNE